MRSGWAVTPAHLVPRTQAAPVRAGAHSTLHGVVFAFCVWTPAVYRRRVSALRPGHEIVNASRRRMLDSTPAHPALVYGRSKGPSRKIDIRWRPKNRCEKPVLAVL